MENRGRKKPRGLFIPEEIIIDILLRLPVKSLMRFKASCKLWNSIISNDPNFAEHRKEWIQKPRLLFQPITSRWHYWIYEIRKNGAKAEKLQPINVTHCLEKWNIEYFENIWLEKFKHGLGALLLCETENVYYQPKCFVYDSINGNRILLPSFPRNIGLEVKTLKPFLMYDVSTKMHKVLVYTKHFDLQDNKYIDSCCITSFCNKTMASENVWRMTLGPVEGRFTLPSNTSIKGIMYWVVRKCIYLGPWAEEKFIMPFDIAEEKFISTIRFPKEISKLKTRFCTYDLLRVRGVLGFMSMTYDEFRIWVLTDSDNSSWDLLHKINMKTMFDRPDKFLARVVFVLEQINCLPSILLYHENKYYWYEMDGKKVKEMNVDEFTTDNYNCVYAWIP